MSVNHHIILLLEKNCMTVNSELNNKHSTTRK